MSLDRHATLTLDPGTRGLPEQVKVHTVTDSESGMVTAALLAQAALQKLPALNGGDVTIVDSETDLALTPEWSSHPDAVVGKTFGVKSKPASVVLSAAHPERGLVEVGRFPVRPCSGYAMRMSAQGWTGTYTELYCHATEGEGLEKILDHLMYPIHEWSAAQKVLRLKPPSPR